MEKILKVIKIISIIAIVVEVKRRCRRRWWVREVNVNREEDGFFNKSFTDIKEKDEEHFFKLTRMNISSFNFLLTLVSSKLEKYSQRKPIDPETRLAITLMYLGHGCSPQILAWSFKIGVSTVREIVYETCEVIYSELREIYLPIPNKDEWSKIASNFYNKTKLPNCIGSIDGKHIRVVCPRNSGSEYYNYKKYYSIILLGICDASYTFTFYKIGSPAILVYRSDSGVFRESTFGEKIMTDSLDLPEAPVLPNSNIAFPYYFVGDAAFPLRKNLMRPYPGKRLSEDKSRFNTKISKARVFIENTFGILANRWRILHTAIYCSPDNINKIISAVVLLHNFLMLRKDEMYFDETMIDRKVNGVVVPGSYNRRLRSSSLNLYNRSSESAFSLRNKLKNYLFRT